MDWTSIDFTSGWAIYRNEQILGYRARVIFSGPLDLQGAIAFRRVCPDLQNKPIAEAKNQRVGRVEYAIESITPEEIRSIQEAGFAVEVEPIVQVHLAPVCTKIGRGLLFDIQDQAVEREFLTQLESASVPELRSESGLIRHPLLGESETVIKSLLGMLEYRPRPRPTAPLPTFEESTTPRFRYIEESILRHYVKEDWCSGCDTFTHVLWLLRDLVIRGELVDAEYVCCDCLRTQEITEYDADKTRNEISARINV